jgi:hypothetical protein
MIHTYILFAKEAGSLDSSSLMNPPAPTFFTGERIHGTFSISSLSTEGATFDTAQILLRGMSVNYQLLQIVAKISQEISVWAP